MVNWKEFFKLPDKFEEDQLSKRSLFLLEWIIIPASLGIIIGIILIAIVEIFII